MGLFWSVCLLICLFTKVNIHFTLSLAHKFKILFNFFLKLLQWKQKYRHYDRPIDYCNVTGYNRLYICSCSDDALASGDAEPSYKYLGPFSL